MSGPISMLVFFEGPPTAEHETPQRALSPNAPRKNVAKRFAQRIRVSDRKPGQAASNFPANAKSTCKATIGGQP